MFIARGTQELTLIRLVLHIWQPLLGLPQYTIVSCFDEKFNDFIQPLIRLIRRNRTAIERGILSNCD